MNDLLSNHDVQRALSGVLCTLVIWGGWQLLKATWRAQKEAEQLVKNAPDRVLQYENADAANRGLAAMLRDGWTVKS